MNQIRVVVVEDESWLAEQYLRILRRDGYEVYQTRRASSAIDVIDDAKPHAIVLDVLLADTTALALLHELQSYTDLSTIPVILVTNLADNLQLHDVKSYGVVALLDKASMHPDDLQMAVRQAMQ